MRGYLKLKAVDFDTWNNAATVKANANNFPCEPYTTCKPDANSTYVWARVEHDFIEGNVVSYEDAKAQGMIEEVI